jgi:hypothetical protein
MVYDDEGGPSPTWSSPISHLPVMCGLLHQPQSAQAQLNNVDNATAKTDNTHVNTDQATSSVSVIFHQALRRYWATCVLQRFVVRVMQPRWAAHRQDSCYTSCITTTSDDKDAFVTDESSKEDEMSKEADALNPIAPTPPPKKRIRSERNKNQNATDDDVTQDRNNVDAVEDVHSPGVLSGPTTTASHTHKSRLLPLQHWLFKSLFQSPSLRVRRTGCRIFLLALEQFGRQGNNITDQNTGMNDGFEFVGGALDRKDRIVALYQYVTTCLMTLTDEVLLDTSMYAISGHAPEGGDPLVQTVGLLSWLVFQTHISCLIPVVASTEEEDQKGKQYTRNTETQVGHRNDTATATAIISNNPLISSTVAELHPLTSSTVEELYANMTTVSRGKKRVLTAPPTATSSKTNVLVEVVDVSAPAPTAAPAAVAAPPTTTSTDAARITNVPAPTPDQATKTTSRKGYAAATKTTAVEQGKEKSIIHNIESSLVEEPACVMETVTLYSVEHFVSLGGVRWIIQCLLQLLLQLSKREARPSLSPAHHHQQQQHHSSAHHRHASHYNHQEAPGSFTWSEMQLTLHYESLQCRITLLLDLLLTLLSTSKNVMVVNNDDAVDTNTKNYTITNCNNRKAAAKYLDHSLLRHIWMSPSSSSQPELMHSALPQQSIHLHSSLRQSNNNTSQLISGSCVAGGRKDSSSLQELSPLAGLISIMHAFSAGTAPGKSVHIGSSSSSSARGGNTSSSSSSSLFMYHPSGNVLGGTTTTTTTTTLNLLTGTVSTSRHLSSSSGGSGGRGKHGRTQNGAPPLCKTMAVVRSYPHYFQQCKAMDRFMSTLLKVFNPLGAMMVGTASLSSPTDSSGGSPKKSPSGGRSGLPGGGSGNVSSSSSSRASAKRKRAAELAAASSIRSITSRGGTGRGAFDTQTTLARLISRSTASLSSGARASVLSSLPAPAGGAVARRSLGVDDSEDDPNDDDEDEDLDDEDDEDLDDEDDDDDEDHDGDAMDEEEDDGVVVDLEEYEVEDDDDDDDVEEEEGEWEGDEQTVQDDDEDDDHGEDTEHEDEDASVMGEDEDAVVAGDEDDNDIIIDDEEIESCCGLDEEEAHNAAIHLMNHEASTGEQGVFLETDDEDWNQAVADAASSRKKTGTNTEERATPSDAPGATAKSSPKAVVKAKGSSPTTSSTPKIIAVAPLDEKERKLLYLKACMEVLEALHPTHQHGHGHHPANNHTTFQTKGAGNPGEEKGLVRSKRVHAKISPMLLLSLSAEQSLTSTMNETICPPPKPCHLKIFLRRAPTQEEFFRGNLSRNPILMSSLKIAGKAEEGSKVSDLRFHIANELQMSDSAELLELLIAGKIVAMTLDLKTLYHTLWKKHVLESSRHASSSSSSAAADSKDFPPMVVTYRLAGVDGEATEDILEETENDALATSKEGGEDKDDAKFSVTDFFADDTRQGGGACGLAVLLRALVSDLHSSLRRIRRDAVLLKRAAKYTYQKTNASVADFLAGPPPPSLVLLRHAARRSKNRSKLVELRAPSVLLRVLLEVLSGIGDLKDDKINATADVLQELIEVLASDINSSIGDESPKASSSSAPSHNRQTSMANSETSSSGDDSVEIVVAETNLPLLLSSLMDTTLTAPLQKVVADLLPFLTYGQVESSTALADQFLRLVDFDYLESHSFSTSHYTTKPLILMRTFLQAAMTLPAVPVCNELRAQLVGRGFLAKCSNFLLKGVPDTPPPWSSALFARGVTPDDSTNESWKIYLSRQNLTIVLKTLTGLCKKHSEAQCVLAQHEKLIRLCHWLESTSFRDFELSLSESLSQDGNNQGAATSDGNNTNNEADTISSVNELGLLSETLLDGIMEENKMAGDKVKVLRKETRNRKKEIAQERRSQTLAVISTSMFGSSSSGLGLEEKTKKDNEASEANEPEAGASSQSSSQGTLSFAQLIANTMFKKNEEKTSTLSSPDKSDMPAWMAEMEGLEDETGLTCAVCQEGLKFQPKELLGLYAYVKKVTIPASKGGNRTNIDGTTLLLSLPATIPPSLKQSRSPRSKKGDEHPNVEEEFYRPAKAASKLMQSASKTTTSSNPLIASIAASSLGTLGGGRNNAYITTVTAGNPIHATCHTKAKQADRNHPKAPKSKFSVLVIILPRKLYLLYLTASSFCFSF